MTAPGEDGAGTAHVAAVLSLHTLCVNPARLAGTGGTADLTPVLPLFFVTPVGCASFVPSLQGGASRADPHCQGGV